MAKNTQTTAEAIEKIKQQEEYGKYVKKMTPVHSLPKNMARAFLSGGIICTIGQGILFSVILTGFNIYPRLAKWGGAGTLVPITGFANSVAAPAIEYQKEGQVFGIGCKIFIIAGPVILYGILTSALMGLIYYTLRQCGIV